MIAIHLDAEAGYQAAAAYCAAKGLDKRMITSDVVLESATGFWTVDKAIAKQYKGRGIKAISQSTVDKWLKNPEESD